MKKLIFIILLSILMVSVSPAQEASLPVAEGTASMTTAAETTAPGMITFSFKDADIRNVLRLISAKSGINIVYGPEVTGIVNMELKDVPWEQALGLVLDLNGFAYQREGNVIKVLKKEDLSKEPLSTEVFVLNYAKADEMSKAVEQILTERGKIKTDVRSNTIIVTDIPANINKIETVLTRLDTRTTQVLIETKIVQMSNIKEKDLGLKWTSLQAYNIFINDPTRTFTDSRTRGRSIDDNNIYNNENTNDINNIREAHPLEHTAIETDTTTDTLLNSLTRTVTNDITNILTKTDIRSAILTADDFQVVLSALQSETDANLISNPRIVTANNETAQVKVVSQYPIPNYTFDTQTSAFTISGFDYKDIGVTLDVTPNISSDGYVTMKIEPQVSVLIDQVPFSAGGATVEIPYIGVKKASAKLVIKSGDTLALGGLVDENKRKDITKIPLLGDIPLFGRLFKHDSVSNVKSDVIFFITATIIDEQTKDKVLNIDIPNSIVEEPPEVYKKVFNDDGKPPEYAERIPVGNKGVIQNKEQPDESN